MSYILTKSLILTTIGTTTIIFIHNCVKKLYKHIIDEHDENVKFFISKIKTCQDEITELQEVIDSLEEKVSNLENVIELKERETDTLHKSYIDLHKSNIDLNNKLDNFITYSYDII